MGLDIAFNRAAALAAGLELITEPRDPDFAKTNPGADQDELDFWNEVATYVKLPGVQPDTLTEDCGSGECIVMRANKWGRVYAPMTEWLKKHNIGWDEF